MSKRRKRRERGRKREKSFNDRSVGVSSGSAVAVSVPVTPSLPLGKIEFVAPNALPSQVPVNRTPLVVPKVNQKAQDYRMPQADKRGASSNPYVPGAPRIGDTVGDDPATKAAIDRANKGKNRKRSDSNVNGVGGELAQIPIPLPRPIPLPAPGGGSPFPLPRDDSEAGARRRLEDAFPKDRPTQPQDRGPQDKPRIEDTPRNPNRIPIIQRDPVPPAPRDPSDRPGIPLVPIPILVPQPRKPVPVVPPIPEEDEPKSPELLQPGGRSYWRRSNRMFTIGKQDRY